MTPAREYGATAREFLAKAQEELAQCELTQVSEKGWGAAAQMVRAVAEQRGWEHTGHALLYQAVRRMVQETCDTQLATLFHVASSLNSNFYENWLPIELVQSGLEDVGQLVKKLEQLLQR